MHVLWVNVFRQHQESPLNLEGWFVPEQQGITSCQRSSYSKSFFQPLLRRWLPISFPRCLEQRSATSISRYQLSNPKERSPDQLSPSLSWPGVWRTMSCPSSWTFWELLRRSATIWTSTMGRRLPTVWELFETLVQVGYKTILHLAIDEDDFDATPFVEACLKVGWDWMGWDMLRLR